MWLMLQQDEPKDYIIATGETHTVREFVELAFNEVDIEIEWEGKGINEIGRNKGNGKIIVELDPRYFRPAEVEILMGDASKAKNELGWIPKTSLQELISEMVHFDLSQIK
jgi:GDP-D-mannose dehydratase